MQIEDWIDIAMDVKNNYERFDSFIILHGTDTMSYTASVLSFMFQNLDKSVILTGSQVKLLLVLIHICSKTVNRYAY